MNSSNLNNHQIYSIYESGSTANPLDEITLLFQEICPKTSTDIIKKVHQDIIDLFTGSYPGFEISTNKYHNLRHTFSVALATIRLFHGLFHKNIRLAEEYVLQGLISAYFHDTGMIPQTGDTEEERLNYASHHEKRSIIVLKKYLSQNIYPQVKRNTCATIIKFTMLEGKNAICSNIEESVKLCGQVVGTADLLAQMADRYYLENLPLLFLEFQEKEMNNYSSAMELMSDTLEFHEKVIKKRLEDKLGDLAYAMKIHFTERWNLDRNLYLENIALNLDYLRIITEDCTLDLSCWKKYLRRNPPNATP